MKKLVSVLALSAVITAGAFAQITLSAGGGFLFDGNYGNGWEQKYANHLTYGKNATVREGRDISGIGLYGFFDATYVEANVYFAMGFPGGYSYRSNDDTGVTDTKYSNGGLVLSLGISVLGKYQLIEMGPLSLFPLLGVSYNMVLSTTDKDGGEVKYPKIDGKEYTALSLSQFGILAGAGADFDINNNLYVRGEALFHLRFASELNNAQTDYDNKAAAGSDPKAITTLGVGPQFKLGVGFRF
jgi:hypothetical protein